LAASRTRPRPARLTAGLVWFHRWLGIATCLVFAAWFASGAILLFQPFPSLGKAEAGSMAAPITAEAARVSPGRALALAGADAGALRLVQRAGVPAYLAQSPGGPVAIDARTGTRLGLLAASDAASIVEAAGFRAARVAGPFGYDQWIVHNQFDPLRPFYRVDLGDPAGTALYVSAVTGEIVQRTTFRERAWNWGGAVLHWVYVTPLRSSFTAWDRSVWWLSFVAMLVAVAGTILGLVRTIAVRRTGRPGLTYFRVKWLRWHHLLGLFASLFVLAWILSGWLSMDHGRLFSRGQASPAEQARYAGMPLERVVAALPASFAQALPGARAIGFTSVGGAALLQVTGRDGRSALFTPDGRPIASGERDRLFRAGLGAAWPGQAIDAPRATAKDELYVLAEGMPDSAVEYRLGGNGTSIYVDGATGAILTVMDQSRAAYAWIYYALHTFNFPGLSSRPVLREILVLIPLLFGLAFSVTGVVIGWQRLRRSLKPNPTGARP
jgi:uncharacterized iron-regulated membrane protein